MLSKKCLLEAEHVGGIMAVATQEWALEVVYTRDPDTKIVSGMTIWLALDMRYAQISVVYDEKKEHYMEKILVAPPGFQHKTGENGLTMELATAFISRFEKNEIEGEPLVHIPDLEQGHENPYVMALMCAAFDYYTGAKHHVKKEMKNGGAAD